MKNTNKYYDELAKKLGYTKVKNIFCHGQAIYEKKRSYISGDVDSHHGGVWKMATTLKELLRGDRCGTYDANLIVRIRK